MRPDETPTPTPASPDTPGVGTTWQAPQPAVRELDHRFLPQAVFSVPKPLVPVLSRFVKLKELMAVFHGIPAGTSAAEFSRKALEIMHIPLEVDPELAATIPPEGPLVIVSNHPFGGVDGLALMATLLPLRPDFKFLINVILGIFPDLRECCLPLDVLSGTPAAFSGNASSLRTASSHLAKGGAVGFFPSGTVSHWQRGKGIVDPEWQIAAARMAKRYNATVLPLFFHGRNSLLFNALGMLHPMARTLMLPREMVRRFGSPIRLSCGRLIEPATVQLLHSPESITSYLRMRCYALGHKPKHACAAPGDDRPMVPVAPPLAPETIQGAFAALPESALLLREGDYALYTIRGGESPLLLEELGALREGTFRLVGEGSGKARDLDIYDERYHHLLLWNEKDACLAGAYRLGKVQELLAEQGPEGLYTTTLFRMTPEFFAKYGNALELGRAVVHPRYQRDYAPLMLLWKGIGRFLMRHQEIHCLFGPVSLSLDYTPTSLRTVVDFLQTQCGSQELSHMVRGRTLPDKWLRKANDIPLPDTLNYNGLVSLVRDIEDGKGIPILFKHYLKLGGKIGAFHLDTGFNTLDAFLLMDLVDSPRNMLERYITPEGAAAFLARWTGTQTPPKKSAAKE